jgi:hypothetical protein
MYAEKLSIQYCFIGANSRLPDMVISVVVENERLFPSRIIQDVYRSYNTDSSERENGNKNSKKHNKAEYKVVAEYKIVGVITYSDCDLQHFLKFVINKNNCQTAKKKRFELPE